VPVRLPACLFTVYIACSLIFSLVCVGWTVGLPAVLKPTVPTYLSRPKCLGRNVAYDIYGRIRQADVARLHSCRSLNYDNDTSPLAHDDCTTLGLRAGSTSRSSG